MALGRIVYKWGEAVAEVVADSDNLLGIRFVWEGKTPATFTQARLQEVEPLFRDPTRGRLPNSRINYKREVEQMDAGDAYWIADILSLFNVAARQRNIITRTQSPDFSFRTTPPNYAEPEVIFEDGESAETVPTI